MSGQCSLLESTDFRFEIVTGVTVAVAPCGDDAAVDGHSAHFREELRRGEPMQRLRHGDQVGRLRGNAAAFGRRHAIFHSGGGHREPDLRGARIGRDHPIEVSSQIARGLSVSGAAVPGKTAARHERHDELIQLVRVARPRRCVRRRLPREEVGKAYFLTSNDAMCTSRLWLMRSPACPSVLKPCISLFAKDFTR